MSTLTAETARLINIEALLAEHLPHYTMRERMELAIEITRIGAA